MRINVLKRSLVSAYRVCRPGDVRLATSSLNALARNLSSEASTKKLLWLVTYLAYRWRNLPPATYLVSSAIVMPPILPAEVLVIFSPTQKGLSISYTITRSATVPEALFVSLGTLSQVSQSLPELIRSFGP